VNELMVLPPVPCWTLFSGMKPVGASVGMSASNLTFAVKFVAVPPFATVTATPMPAPGPGSSPGMLVAFAHSSPPAVMVTVIFTGTENVPPGGLGLVQLTLLCHVAVLVPAPPTNARVVPAPPLRLAFGRADELDPQKSLAHEVGLKLENATFRPPESPALG